MEAPVSLQAAQALYSALFGAAAGALYDLNRAVRAAGGAFARAAADLLYCAAAAAAAFFFVMTALDGAARGSALACAAAGWALYGLSAGRFVRRALGRFVNYWAKLRSRAAADLSIFKKMRKFQKNIFSKPALRVKMYIARIESIRGSKIEGSKRRETRKGVRNGSSDSGGPHSVNADRPPGRRRGDRETRIREGRAGSPGPFVRGGKRRAEAAAGPQPGGQGLGDRGARPGEAWSGLPGRGTGPIDQNRKKQRG